MSKFELPARPEALFREQSIEDYSDLIGDEDDDGNIFGGSGLQQKKVNEKYAQKRAFTANMSSSLMLLSCSTHRT